MSLDESPQIKLGAFAINYNMSFQENVANPF